MNTFHPLHESTRRKSLRLWPGIVIVLLQWLSRFVLPELFPDAIAFGFLSIFLFGLALAIWWAFFSRAPAFERWFAIVLMVAGLVATSQIIDKSIATANVGLMFAFYSIPVMSLAFVVWAVASRNFTDKLRRITMVFTILLASGFWALLRTNGMDAEIHHEFAWRWATTAEESLISTPDQLTSMPLDSEARAKEPEWAGFRGTNRDGIVHGSQIETDWTKNSPVELWRRPVGPGCSSFAVHGDLMFTQEQRGDYEMVTCYHLNTGDPVWKHSDSTRFWDAHAGAGPRSTPTLYKGRLYSMGATGIVNVLDEATGTLIWTRNAAKDTHVEIPGWGYTGSPLVVDSTVFISISGQILAYDISNGHLRWSGKDGGESYCSPHLMVNNDTKQVLFTNKEGLTSYAPADGNILWNLSFPGIRVIQPALINETDLLINQEERKALKRIAVNKNAGVWKVEERWTSENLKPDYNDIVIHKGYVYGFEGGLSLACIDIEKGERKWKGARYGGQLILLADQDILLVLTEKGEIALVKAIPGQFTELARFPAIKGKTWNHPVLAGHILLVRNTQEMVAFRL